MEIIKGITNWKDLLEYFADLKRGDFFYRGVTDADYELIPKVGREGVIEGGWDVDEERQLLVRFKIWGQPHAVNLLANGYEMEWLILGQHHGLPTRLLDWSNNPLVAVFFAVEWSGKETDAAIYIETPPHQTETVATLGQGWHIENNEDFVFLSPDHITRRISSQAGVFTIHPAPTEPLVSDTLRKIVIPSDARLEIQKSLDRFDINRASLFPDLDGIAARIAWEYRWDKP